MQHYLRHAQFGNFKFRSRQAHQCFHFKKLEFSFCVLILDEISFTYFQIPLKLQKNPRLKNKTLFGSYFLYQNRFKD